MSNAPYSPPPYSAPPALGPAPIEVAFAPLPLRPRSVLENLDLAFKLFKQYWKPLLAWAAVANVLMTVVVYLGVLIAPPFIVAPTCCVLAAAVRGQHVSFKQCWGFARPRIWNLLAVHVLSGVVAALVVGTLCMGLFALSVWISSSLPPGSGIASFLIGVVVILAMSVVLSMALAWQGMVGMVACMEDENRDTSAMKRAWVLLRGRWKAALGLLTILNLALLVLWGTLWGVVALIMGIDGFSRALEGGGNGLPSFQLLGTLTASSWMLFTLYMPLYYLAQALFYLDARVRHEALDLEWDAHRSEVQAPAPHYRQANAPQTFFEPIATPGANTSPAWASNPFASQPPHDLALPATSPEQKPEPSQEQSSAEAIAPQDTWSSNSPFAPR